MLTALVIIMAFITAIYPAVKALRLKPAEAVRKNNQLFKPTKKLTEMKIIKTEN
jgi:hypothetical protein